MVSCHSKIFSAWIATIILLLWTYYSIFLVWIEQGSSIITKRESKSFVNIDEMNCNCSSRTKNASSFWTSEISNCDGFAAFRGANQMVVSYSFFGVIGSAYFPGIKKNAELISKFYPNWVMRVYHDLDVKNESVRVPLCDIWCKYPHVDFCRMQKLPPKNQTALNPKIWRFYPLGDPLVARFVVRDLDSLIIEREVAAVGHWMISGKTWHFMHDHEFHHLPIMGGMWGAMNRNLTLNKDILERIILEAQKKFVTGNDQTCLAVVLLPIVEASGDYINHHSYPCRSGIMERLTPFPVKRLNKSEYIGSPTLRYQFPINSTCPGECRPPGHQDWDLC